GAQPRPPHLPVRHQVARRGGLPRLGAGIPPEGRLSVKKRSLGRGLDALLMPPEREEAAVNALPISSLRPNRLQPRTRFDEEGLEELAESIRAQGVLQPIVVTPEGEGTYSIVAGERRWRAAQRAGLAVVPVVVREVAEDRQRLELAL